jgi:hypothetical protein
MYNPYAHDADTYILNEKVNLQSSNESIADTERNVKVGREANSKIPSIFDHVIRNSSTIKSNYHLHRINSGNYTILYYTILYFHYCGYRTVIKNPARFASSK